MLYSRLLAPWLLWLVLMLTNTAVRNNSTEQCLRSSTSSSETSSSSGNGSSTCLVLTSQLAGEICSRQRDWANVSLPYCGRPLHTTIPSLPFDSSTACVAALERLLRLDATANAHSRNFRSILDRFDCPQPYSVKFTCAECQVAYQNWICSDSFSYWRKGRRYKPCRSYCRRVEQTCPFFLPLDKGPAHYAGEPTFLCLDPNIEETGEQQARSSYGVDSCCYEDCDSGQCTIRGDGCGDDGNGPFENSAPRRLSDGTLAAQLLILLSTILINRTRLLI